MPEKPATVEDYLAALAPEVREAVLAVRAAVRDAVPDGEDAISYDIPAVRLGGRTVVHYAGWKHHVSVYPVPEGDAELQRDLAPYVAGKGTCKFPLSEPLPTALITRLAAALLAERQPDQG